MLLTLLQDTVLMWEERKLTCFYIILVSKIELFKLNKSEKVGKCHLIVSLTLLGPRCNLQQRNNDRPSESKSGRSQEVCLCRDGPQLCPPGD